MRFLIPLIIALMFAISASSQDIPSNPFAVRLVRTWKLDRVQTRDGMQTQPTMVEFRMTVISNGTLTQGLYPEGMFESTWQFDAMKMNIRISDVQSAATYVPRVFQLTNNQLVLEAIENGERTLMYYVPLR